ncbi:hypothetical protein GUJ93_ZPchr0008g13721 [Zizania palustris]|uniref:Uncharacterized protein n=1 Tax=Zizania palustris TaxID=103762 RepID=A0A8J5VK36_ZIZPA|nr:hypothetical protein GUJ93_ZPchr0008g13721 [Zizania palustris]
MECSKPRPPFGDGSSSTCGWLVPTWRKRGAMLAGMRLGAPAKPRAGGYRLEHFMLRFWHEFPWYGSSRYTLVFGMSACLVALSTTCSCSVSPAVVGSGGFAVVALL